MFRAYTTHSELDSNINNVRVVITSGAGIADKLIEPRRF